jgi:hypothetical protein
MKDLQLLNREDFLVFTTREFAFINGQSISAASERLKRLEQNNLITKVSRALIKKFLWICWRAVLRIRGLGV